MANLRVIPLLAAHAAAAMLVAVVAGAVATGQVAGAAGTRAGKRRPRGGVDTLPHFEAFCLRLTMDNGRPLELEEFQRKILRSYFDGCREVLVLLPKKNGKTTLMAALALYHLMFTPEAACYIAAASRDQAGIMFGQAAGFVRRSPGLQARMRVFTGYREIRSRADGGFIRVLAADADTADGVIPTLALVDELHRHKSSDLYGVFRDGLGPRNGRLITISTAGSDEDSALGLMRRAALVYGAKRRGAYTTASSPNGLFVLHEWSLAPAENLENLRRVKLANPASFVTLENLKDRRDSPSMTPHQWARFACNVWAQDDEAAIAAVDWGRVARKGCEIPHGSEIILGVDLGWTRDTTALVPVWRRTELTDLERKRLEGAAPAGMAPFMLRVGRPRILTPPGDGQMLDEEEVFGAVRDFAELYRVTVVIDPNADGQRFAQRLERELGLEVGVHSQKSAPMAEAARDLSEAIRGRTLEHPDDPGLNAHVLAARAKWLSGEAWMLVKPRNRRKVIDAAVAMAMAVHVSLEPPEEPPMPFVIRAA